MKLPQVKLKIAAAFFLAISWYYSFSQNSRAVDSIKQILDSRYDALAMAMDKQDLDKILSFKTSDFHAHRA